MTDTPWPTQIHLKDKGKQLSVTFEGGLEIAFTAEFLRVMSPSAEVQGHNPDQRKVIAGKKDVTIIGVDPVGNYAIKPTFDDLHDTGIFTWAYFQELHERYDFLWKRYLKELEERGLRRDKS
ncbi:hypothetical protein PsAD2_04154 [Pseudovibrio axinellae]|uniref:Gamma-butyrobetaine hydroxylase-like N-terminal domain-containing protein n=1 Tax=Pseudovibrio axinellae TaxID=989403 RepID=A0A161X9A3_9HYPH|nr:DUF971 domain-containing protein [Pseudovibrio axinellae]KZL08485.1 hypothetical protein PsAD2_04154 [Pseudovibrio axinellae]SEP75738.1 DUF971 family protein [Pseudovibrio axinellae]